MNGLLGTSAFLAALALAQTASAGNAASGSTTTAPCIPVSTAADLNNVRYKLTDRFCLMNDIDFQGTDFVPIGGRIYPFLGDFDGQGHAIRNIRMISAARDVGLFGVIGTDDTTAGTLGTVHDIRVEGAEIANQVKKTNTGILVGLVAASGWVDRAVTYTGTLPKYAGYRDGPPNTGGLAGRNDGRITNSSSAANVIGYSAGGLVGYNAGTISQSYATGRIQAPVGGGLVGVNTGDISNSFAVGSVQIEPYSYQYESIVSIGGLVGTNNGGRVLASFALGRTHYALYSCSSCYPATPQPNAGGLVGLNLAGGKVIQSYSTGAAGSDIPSYQTPFLCGGLVGQDVGSQIVQSYAISKLKPQYCYKGGLANTEDSASRASHSYWVLELANTPNSSEGTPLSEAQLKLQLPDGFDTGAWAINPGVSFPYLKRSEFASPLATTVAGEKVFVFAPLGQFDSWNYYEPATHKDQASRAAVFTMIGQAIGRTLESSPLETANIDTFNWEDTIQRAYWRGPVAHAADLGPLTPLVPGAALCRSPILAATKHDQVAVVRGAYNAEHRVKQHWMLATSFTVDDAGKPAELVANDPWTGKQVRIDCGTGAVTMPANFPLPGFKLDAYQLVTFRAAMAGAS